ncbi:ABC transporter ATP-binding protein [Tepidanaerobacter syntrophicus]|uniref:ABC transporter ATP-binding protein n=1 Tax=Tepidanaerobacter syntrophicus TaxID=224999 RepID=UPI001BD4A829|nr:ABC transporter ATP-binding protein [Tepidanaerobacter syntrophicus]
MKKNLLELKNVTIEFQKMKSNLKAVDGISFTVKEGEVLGIVGESGSGKSLTALSILGIVPYPGKVTKGEILFKGRDLLNLDEKEMTKVRGNYVSMIFQDPRVSLDPVYKIGDQLIEAIQHHKKVTLREAQERALKLLNLVGIPHPKRYIEAYPHELSGGMCQRIMIAIALSCQPELLIADEPTTALDVTVQAQILELLKNLRQDLKMSVILITHDLGIIADMADKIVVMYAGQIVESGYVSRILTSPLHPYTRGLLKSVLQLESKANKLYTIPGNVPGLANMPKGCRFFPRCSESIDICSKIQPPVYSVNDEDYVCCHKYS